MLAVLRLNLIGDEPVEIIGEHAVGGVDQRHLRAARGELLGELGANVARADHDYVLQIVRALLDLHRVIPVLA